jgi:aldehyde dehydrogenase (NAD+)
VIALLKEEIEQGGEPIDWQATAHAQQAWAERTVSERARLIGSLRPLLSACANDLARAAAEVGERPLAEKMVSEVLPLVEAAHFLEKNAARILRPQRFGRKGRPLWLHGSSFEVHRKPHGVVLVVGPSNYPLFIPLVQTLHALAAGNAVLVKPAEGASKPVQIFHERVLRRSAIPTELVQVLREATSVARNAARRADKVFFTGATDNGRDLLHLLAERNTPAVMELSGADTVFVRADADVALAAKAIAFGLRLNAGNTCMAPHSIVVHEAVAEQLKHALQQTTIDPETIYVVADDVAALEIADFDPHGLGAAIFSRDESAARKFAQHLRTGFVTINDIIVPTADPRFPFGGVRGSGFGVTRGAEGLLEMTYPHCVAIRRARILPHLDEPQSGDAEFFGAYISLMHGAGVQQRWRALRNLVQLGRSRVQRKKELR